MIIRYMNICNTWKRERNWIMDGPDFTNTKDDRNIILYRISSTLSKKKKKKMNLVSREGWCQENDTKKRCASSFQMKMNTTPAPGEKNALIGSYRGSFIPFEMAITRREAPTVISLMADNNCQRLLWWGGIWKRDRPRVESEWINNWKRQDSSRQSRQS